MRSPLVETPVAAGEDDFAFLALAHFCGAPPAVEDDKDALAGDAGAFAVPFFLEAARAPLECAGERLGSAGGFPSSALWFGFAADFGLFWPDPGSPFRFRAVAPPRLRGVVAICSFPVVQRKRRSRACRVVTLSKNQAGSTQGSRGAKTRLCPRSADSNALDGSTVTPAIRLRTFPSPSCSGAQR